MTPPRQASWGNPAQDTPPTFDADTCPLCGDPARIRLDDTEDGPEWVGQCVRCNTLWELFE